MSSDEIELPGFFDGINFLGETAIAFSSSAINQVVYKYIAESLSRLNPDASIVVNSVNMESRKVTTEVFLTPGKLMRRVRSLLGFDLVGKVFPMDESIHELTSGSIMKFQHGIHELSFGAIPVTIAIAIEKLLNLKHIYGIAFMIDNRIFANAALLFPVGKDISHRDVLESFVRQASVTLKRIEAEKNEARYRSLLHFMSLGAFYRQTDGRKIEINETMLENLTMQDLALQKQAEDKLRQLAEQSKKAEEDLRISENRARALMNAIPDMIFRMNDQLVILDYKARREELYYQQESLAGKNCREVLPPEFTEILEKQVTGVLSSQITSEFEYQLLVEGSGLLDFEARMVPSGIDEVTTIVRNITSRKETERRIAESETNARMIMEASTQIMFLVDKNFRVLHTNEAHCKRLNKTRDELVGKSIKDYLPEEIAENRIAKLNEVFKSGNPVFFEDYHDGFFSDIAIHPVKNVFGEVDRLVIFIQDITNRKHDEILLKQNEKKLKELNDSKDRFFFNHCPRP